MDCDCFDDKTEFREEKLLLKFDCEETLDGDSNRFHVVSAFEVVQSFRKYVWFYSKNVNVTYAWNVNNNIRSKYFYLNYTYIPRDEFICDIKLETDDGTTVDGHKIVLASVASYFRAMFTSYEQSKNTIFFFRELDSTALQFLVDYIYTIKLEVTEDNVKVLLCATDLPINYVRYAYYFVCPNLERTNAVSYMSYDWHILTAVAKMCKRRRGAHVKVLNGVLYAVGDRSESEYLNSVEVYSPSAGGQKE